MANPSKIDLYCPSVDACTAFGIRRSGAKKNDNNYQFLKGPQFSGIKPYSGGSDTGAIDEVFLEFIGNEPVRLKPKNEGGIVKMEMDTAKANKPPLYTMSIAPQTTDWLKFGFTHEWNEGDGIMSHILDTVSGLLDSASGIVNTAQNVTNSDSPQPRRKVTLDKQDSYSKTDKLSFKIPFILFSSGKGSEGDPIGQWIEDVYKPLILITTWSHPKRQTGVVDFGKGKDGNPVQINTNNDQQDTATALRNAQQQGGSNGDGGLQEEAVKFLSSYPGMRVAISEPPSYVRVSHSSGFFKYNVCAITGFSYSFEGPWVKAHSLLEKGNSKITDSNRQLMDITLPMVAKCELEIKVIEKMYADDWISMFENSNIFSSGGGAAKKDGIISVLKKPYSSQEGQPQT